MRSQAFKARLIECAAASSLVLVVLSAGFWAYSQWRFSRVTITYGLPSSNSKDRRIMLLAWSDAAEVMVQTEDLQPDSDCTDQQLRAALSRIGDVQLYQQERLSTSVGAERDVANLWCFHYRSPAEAQAINLSYSTPRDADGTHYQASIKVERAFFVSWWLLTAVTMLLPALVAWDRLRQSWRARSGRCRKCGYDLAKNVSGICPECGSPIQDRAESTSTQESQRQNA